MEEHKDMTLEPGADTPESTSAGGEEEIRVLACVNCHGPVPSNLPKCYTCGTPLTGKEFIYVARQEAGPDIVGMVKWWAILSVGVFALGGFSFGVGSSIAFTIITVFYLIRIMRAYLS